MTSGRPDDGLRPDNLAAQCGFPRHNERHLSRMLLFQDVYDRRP